MKCFLKLPWDLKEVNYGAPDFIIHKQTTEKLSDFRRKVQRRSIKLTVEKAVPLLERMEEDTNGKLKDTLNQLKIKRVSIGRLCPNAIGQEYKQIMYYI